MEAVGAEELLLLVRRPAAGLLAGQWEFPSALVAEGAGVAAAAASRRPQQPDGRLGAEGRRHAVDDYFRDTLRLDLAGAAGEGRRRDVGELTHVFSHVKHLMLVEQVTFDAVPPALRLTGQSAGGGASACAAEEARQDGKALLPEMKWATRAELAVTGLTAGMLKVLRMVDKDRSAAAATATAGGAQKKKKKTVAAKRKAPK